MRPIRLPAEAGGETAEERRAARKDAIAKAREDMRSRDLEAIDAIEIELGDDNVFTLEVTGGPVAVVAVRCPRPSELKRFQARINKDKIDSATATEEIGKACVVYPAPGSDELTALFAARPGIVVIMGNEALKFSGGKSAAAGNE